MRTSTNLLIKFSYIHISEAFNFVTIIRRSESIYTIRRSVAPPWWRRLWAHCFGPLPEEPRLRTIVPNHLVPPKTPKSQHPNGDRADNRWERVAGTTRIRRWIRTIDYPLRCTLLQGTHNKVHGVDLPTSQPTRAVPPRGQFIFHLYRAA